MSAAAPLSVTASDDRRPLLPQGPLLRYDFTGPGRSVLDAHLTVRPEAPIYRLVLFPELRTPDEGPDHSSAFIGLSAITDDQVEHQLVDQHHWPVAAGEPGVWVTDQWNQVDLNLTRLVGRTVDIVLTSPGGDLRGSGHLQLVGPVPAPDPHTAPLNLVRTSRGSHQHSGDAISRGNTYPMTNVPHGFNFLTPVTDARSHRWFYSWAGRPGDADPRPTLQALAISHCPSPWMADRLAFQLMPWTGTATVDPLARERRFSHADEFDRPHHYRVRLDDGVVAEMAPTSHCGFFRFDFLDADSPQAGVVFDMPGTGELTLSQLQDGRLSFSGMIDPPKDWLVDWDEKVEPLAGYVYGETRQPVQVIDVTSREGIPELPTNLGRAITRNWPKWLRVKVDRDQSGAVQLLEGSTLEVVVGMSQISTRQARHNLRLEIGEGSFDQVRDLAARTWRGLLDRLEITGGTHDQRVSAYSNLARLYSWPNQHDENAAITAADPEWVYASPFKPAVGDHQRHSTGAQVVHGQLLVNNGFWDTFRTCWPAYHLFTPRRSQALLDGIVQQYLDGGWMARWSAPGYCDIMVGTSSDAVFADASAHGITFNELAGYDSALRNATTPSSHDEVGRKGIARGRFVGYIDSDTPEGFSWSMDNANSDAALALWSARLAERGTDPARTDEFRANTVYFARRAMGYQQLFDPAIGFLRPRTPDGGFRDGDDFDPLRWGRDYTETNAWGMAFHAPFDGAGLAALMGGEQALADKLDQAAATPETASLSNALFYGGAIHEMLEARALRMGQFGMSNQPAHHMPFMWTHTGQHHRTQWFTREILERGFTGSGIGQGYPGDEDNGEMSAWWLLAAAGLYPLAVGSGELVITAPLFERFAFRRDDETTIEVRAGHVEHRYIQSVTINGEPWHRVTVPVERLQGDVTIQVELGPQPSGWAGATRPFSLSSIVPDGTWHPDLTSTATASHPALADDLGTERVTLAAGEAAEFTWPGPVTASVYTLTSPAVDAVPAVVEFRGLDGHWYPAHAQPRPAIWANQTLAHLLFEGGGAGRITGLRIVPTTVTALLQVEAWA
ncbi:GH92 family glycosyl hydrolase [Propionibacteriaceae bacterium G1746]|uniref:GH92 family glycosyl hydrolase n=1 Tax=Aestuariimicrobium sp. G57 TaxID=3418485 RepID=UPI003C238D07